VPGQLGVRLSANGFRSDEFPGNQGGTTGEQPQSGTIALDARAKLGPEIEWDLSGSIGSLDTDYYVDTGTYTPVGFKANSVRSRLAADTPFGTLQLDAYRNENLTSANGAEVADNWVEDVIVVKVSDLVKLGTDHVLRAAVEYRDNSASSLQSFNGRIGYTIVAGSLMWDWGSASGSRFIRKTATRRRRCRSMLISHRTAPRKPDAAGSACSRVAWARICSSGASWNRNSEPGFNATNSSCISNRYSTETSSWSRSRHW
jgi:hypothetical protein